MAGTDGDQHGPGAEGDDGADRQAGLPHGGEVRGLEEREQQPGPDERAHRRAADGGRAAGPPAYGEHPQQHRQPAGAPPERQGERAEVTGQEEE